MLKPTATVSEKLDLRNRRRVPWPLPDMYSEVDVEILSRPCQASSKRQAGTWVYFIRVSVWNASTRKLRVSLRGLRIRKAEAADRSWKFRHLNLSRELIVNGTLQQPPPELRQAFKELVQAVIDRWSRR